MIATSRLQTLLNTGQFVVSAELTPPRHYNVNALMSKAEKIAAYVDVVQLNDNVLSQARLSNVVAAHFIKQAGIEPVVQLTLRHKNRIALQSDLLGLAALGIRNVMVLGGYPCSIGTDPDAKDATDISAVNAIAAIHNLTTHGRMFNGDAITPAPDFYLGTIAFPSATSASELDASMAQLQTKIDSGTRYVQLQASFELAPVQRWMAEVVKRGLHQQVHFIAAIFPFSSWKGLEFLQKIPGLDIPQELVERIRSGDKSESLKVTVELVQGIRAIEGIRGLHMRSISSGDCIPQIVELAGLRQQVLA